MTNPPSNLGYDAILSRTCAPLFRTTRDAKEPPARGLSPGKCAARIARNELNIAKAPIRYTDFSVPTSSALQPRRGHRGNYHIALATGARATDDADLSHQAQVEQVGQSRRPRPDRRELLHQARDTPGNKLEIHVLSGASDYQTFILQTQTSTLCGRKRPDPRRIDAFARGFEHEIRTLDDQETSGMIDQIPVPAALAIYRSVPHRQL